MTDLSRALQPNNFGGTSSRDGIRGTRVVRFD
jgi:hypothetical protein